MTSNALVPFLEENQGAVSLLALVLALVFALWEMRRANSANRARVYEALSVMVSALDICQFRLDAAKSDAEGMAEGDKDVQVATKVNEALDRVYEVGGVVLSSTPPSATVLISLTELQAHLREGRLGVLNTKDAVLSYATARLHRIKGFRQSLDALRKNFR